MQYSTVQYSTVQYSQCSEVQCSAVHARYVHHLKRVVGLQTYIVAFFCLCASCRYLVEAPANVCTPRHLAAAAAHIKAISPERFSLKV
jgi:leucyl aminopeptidase